jgi:hypothetical protein
MTLLSSGAVSAAEPQIAELAAAPTTAPSAEQAAETTPATVDQAAEATTATTVTTAVPEQNNPHSLASRNAAAMKLKSELDKQNAAPGSKTN